MDFPIFENEKYIMREVAFEDSKDIFEYYSNREFMRYTATSPHKLIKETETLIRKLSSSFHDGKGIAWAIAEKSTEKAIGNISLSYISDTKTKATVGYNVSFPNQNQGIATWALSNCISFGLNQLKLYKIEVKCKSVNLASERVMQKCGMLFIEMNKSPFLVDGIYYDIKTYSITK